MNIKADLASLEPKTEFTRREFVVTVLAVGFAAAPDCGPDGSAYRR